ncbi:MAG: hypothetical protein RI967_1807 [Planctomycetota bacterium]
MRCRDCGHPLWNQPVPSDGGDRACSECGALYRPSSYEFMPGKVRFACPDCGTGYFGTDARGQLEPASFDCAGCGRALTVDACVVSPDGAWSSESDDALYMRAAPLPWFGGGSLVRRWWATLRRTFPLPGEIARGLPPKPDFPRAWLFLAIQSWLVALAGLAFVVLMFAIASGTGAMRGVFIAGTPATLTGLLFLFAQFLLAPVFSLVGIACAAGVARLGAGPTVSFARLLEVSCYASGGLLLGVIPGCGGFIGWIVWLVHTAMAFARLVPRERASATVILAVLGALLGGCVGGGFGFLSQALMGF